MTLESTPQLHSVLTFYVCSRHFITVDVLTQGSWKLLNELDDPELKDLASRLPATVLRSRADSTTRKYLGAYRRWRTWVIDHKLDPIPAKPHEFVLYFQYLSEESKSKAAVEEACNAIAWIHSSAGLASPSAHPFVEATLKGFQRSLAKPVTKKEPITVEMLDAIVQDAERSGSLSDLRLATACLLGFAAFLRFDELMHLRPCDFTITNEMMKIKIVRSKTDQLRQGDEVVVARTKSSTCPVAMMEHYLSRTNTKWSDQRFLFQPI